MMPDLISANAAQCPVPSWAHSRCTAEGLTNSLNSEEQPQMKEGAVNPVYDNHLQEQKGSWGWGKREGGADLFSGAPEGGPGTVVAA